MKKLEDSKDMDQDVVIIDKVVFSKQNFLEIMKHEELFGCSMGLNPCLINAGLLYLRIHHYEYYPLSFSLSKDSSIPQQINNDNTF